MKYRNTAQCEGLPNWAIVVKHKNKPTPYLEWLPTDEEPSIEDWIEVGVFLAKHSESWGVCYDSWIVRFIPTLSFIIDYAIE